MQRLDKNLLVELDTHAKAAKGDLLSINKLININDLDEVASYLNRVEIKNENDKQAWSHSWDSLADKLLEGRKEEKNSIQSAERAAEYFYIAYQNAYNCEREIHLISKLELLTKKEPNNYVIHYFYLLLEINSFRLHQHSESAIIESCENLAKLFVRNGAFSEKEKVLKNVQKEKSKKILTNEINKSFIQIKGVVASSLYTFFGTQPEIMKPINDYLGVDLSTEEIKKVIAKDILELKEFQTDIVNPEQLDSPELEIVDTATRKVILDLEKMQKNSTLFSLSLSDKERSTLINLGREDIKCLIERYSVSKYKYTFFVKQPEIMKPTNDYLSADLPAGQIKKMLAKDILELKEFQTDIVNPEQIDSPELLKIVDAATRKLILDLEKMHKNNTLSGLSLSADERSALINLGREDIKDLVEKYFVSKITYRK